MGSIDRIRYYDGEFLRAFDFGDEQTYHIEMRRRLNRYLHLYGIVEGLQLSNDPTAIVQEVSILPGMAIDAFGREIYVFAPYTLGDADISANRIPAGGGNYDVWLRYNKTPATPPSSGYGLCNQANQYTRWMESFSVVLLLSPSNPFTPPAFTDDDSDDPSQDQVGVLLGTVTVTPGSATAQFATPKFHHRHFLGAIAQRIQTPPGYDATHSFNFPVKQSPRNPPVSLEVEPNIFAKQNLILGPDFDLTATPGWPPTPAPTSNPAGSAKLAGDLFVQGNVYLNFPGNNPQITAVSQYIQQSVEQFLPETIPFTYPVKVTSDATATYMGAYATDTTPPIPVSTTRIRNVTSTIVLAYFSQFESTDHVSFATLFALGQWQLSIIAPATAVFPANSQNGNVFVTWLAGPATGTPPTSCAIDNFTISGVVICFP